MKELFVDLVSLRPLFHHNDEMKFFGLLILMFIGSVLEAIGIGAIPAFVSLIMSPSSLAENEWIGAWFRDMPEEINSEILLWASLGLMVFIVMKNVFLTFVSYMQAKIVTEQQAQLGDRMFSVYQSAPYEWHLARSSSELLRNIQYDTSQILRGVLLPFLDLVMAIMMTGVVTFVLVFSMPPPVMLSLLFIAVGLYAVMRLVQEKLRASGHVVWIEHQGIIKAIQQGFGALADARIFGCEKSLREVHEQSLRRQTQAQRVQLTIQKSSQYAIETIAVMGFLSILILLVYVSDSLPEILPVVVLMGVATVRLKQFATRISASINQLNSAKAFIPRIVSDYLELETIEKDNRVNDSAEMAREDLENLKLAGVSYSYPESDTPAVNNISLTINKGEQIGFVGATGCGKTTLINLMLGLLKPGNGQVLANGQDIQDDIRGWQSRLGYIPQSIFLLDDSIRANVAFGVPEDEIDELRLSHAFEQAQLTSFIAGLKEGFATVIGERGVRLSGGQRQRIGIARALYFEPEVLIFDEATSALDNETEAEIINAIQFLKKNRTVIMIAHRLSTIKSCDRLYFLRDGVVEDVGEYEELVERSDYFRSLVRAGQE